MHAGLPLAAALLAVAFAALVKGALGFGFPLIAVPVVASLLGPRTAVVALTLPGLLANTVILVKGRRVRWERWYLWLLAGLVAGTVVGADLVRRIDQGLLALTVGLVSLAILAAGPLLRRLASRPAGSGGGVRRLSVLAGVLGGLLGGTTDMFSPILAAYLQLLPLDAEAFVTLLTTLFLLGGGLQTATFALTRLYGHLEVEAGLAACIPMWLGTWAGIRLRPRLRSRAFRTAVTALIILTSLNLIRRGFTG